MKKSLLTLFTSLAACFASQADTITLWDFNFPTTASTPTGDTNGLTGTFTPFIGTGTFNILTVTSNRFGGTSASSDPWVADNSALRLAGFPSSTTGNKTAGIEFFSSTEGYENIQVMFDQENSGTASRYWRAQYTIDGSTWIDHTVLMSAGSTDWLNNRIVDLSTITGVKNNPNFGFRLVSEFESTATGSGVNAYVPNSSASYSSGGTHWMDMVTLMGTVLDNSNTDPTISAIADQTNSVNQTIGPIAFTVGDAETAAGSLTLSAQSSNEAVIPTGNVSFGGSGANRTVTLTPSPNQSGLVQMTVTVTDGGGKAASALFDVLVVPPTILVSNVTIRANTSGSANATILNDDGFSGAYTVSATAADTTLLPPGSIVVSGSGANRTINFTPAANQIGGSVVTVTATDGSLSTSFDMFFKAVDPATIAFWDFNSKVRDNTAVTGDINPSIGSGTANNVGTATNSLTSNVSAASSDSDTGDNSKWRFGSFPVQGTDNKTSGAEFRFSTVGYESLIFSWDHYNSASGSRYWRLQYSTDGVNFVDHNVITNPVETTFTPMSVNLSAITGLNNNPDVAIRLVSEFEDTATGQGTAAYIGTQTSGGYSTGGTLWLDTVQFMAAPYNPANTTPTISAINTQTTRVDTASAPIAFTVSDVETPASSLVVTASSSAPGIANTFSFGGSGQNRTITVTPEAGQTGNADITVRVTDAGGKFADSTFTLVVLPANTPPTMSTISNQTIVVGTVTNIPFTVGDLETDANSLSFTMESLNGHMLPLSAAQVTGAGNNRGLQFTVDTNNLGGTRFRLIVSDGVFSVTNQFYVKVVRPSTIALWDFNSVPADNTASTGSYLPVTGSGTATNVVATATFGILGSGNPLNRTSDPAPIADNTSLRLATFPAQSTGNKTAGVQLNFSTVGYKNIAVSWDQQNSSSASRYWRVQYTTDGVNYVDHTGYTNLLDAITFPYGADFTGIAGAENNPNFGIRIVSEWESTATAQGLDSYKGVQASGNYGTGGTFWSDMFLVTGESTATQVTLQVVKTGGGIQISWPSSAGANLQYSDSLGGSWQPIVETPVESGGQYTVAISTSGSSRFFRLVQ